MVCATFFKVEKHRNPEDIKAVLKKTVNESSACGSMTPIHDRLPDESAS